MTTIEIVQKLWSLCNVLRDDGITYHQYVTELTYILFLKMAQETGAEKKIPAGYRWADLTAKDGTKQHQFYRKLLLELGTNSKNRVQDIYANASTNIDEPKNLAKIVTAIDGLDWYSAREEGLGDLYEGLLQKNADEKKSGAGQYFTPRPLISAMVQLVQPQLGERCGDPACGTFGFMIVADQYLKEKYDNYFGLTTEQQEFQQKQAFTGIELVRDAHRLALMNAMLHNIEGEIRQSDALSGEGKVFRDYDVILTNPPFGTKRGGERPTRDDLTYPSSNKQLNFLQMIYRSLKSTGKARAAVVLPDNVLFADGDGQKIRADLMDKCDLHTVLRLPTGIFYAQGVKTNVLFFTRGKKDKGNTQNVWFYDLRTNMPNFGKRTPLTVEHFKEFIHAFGNDPYGKARRKDQGESGRFRCFTRAEIAKRNDSLDITWLQDDSVRNGDDLADPTDLADEILAQLSIATQEMQELARLLGETN
ncbi:MAG: SAM-dependent methyltransferase [Desulfobacteraceae bacterium]|nr:MAG: SAM-dependent methyltransferase [Desulfobacteraceae bacterium]